MNQGSIKCSLIATSILGFTWWAWFFIYMFHVQFFIHIFKFSVTKKSNVEELWSMSDKLFFGYQQWAKPFGLRFDYHQPLAGVFLNRFFAIFAGKQLCWSLFLKKVTCNISGGCVSIKNSVYNFKIWGKLNKQSLFQLTVNFTVREAMYLVFMKQLN